MSVEAIIDRISGWGDSDNIIIEQIGGLTNKNYKVTISGDHCL